MEKILSVSVAAYNVEKFIEKNLNSFIDSDVKNDIEVLVINDGSTDSTAKIVSEYEKKYPTVIKLINQDNAGPGSTINSGIRQATGKYFKMVDGDDWVDTKNLKEYINYLKEVEVDLVVTNYKCVDNNTFEELECKIENVESKKELLFANHCRDLSLAMHNVAYKTEILKKNNIKIDNGFYTDVEFLLLPIQYVKTFAFIELNIYMYRVSLLTQSMNPKSMQKNIKMHDIVLKRLIDYYQDILNKEDIEWNVKNFIKKRIVDMTSTQLSVLLSFKPNKEYKKDIIDLFKYIEIKSSNIYNDFSRYKTPRLLLKTHFSVYRIMAILKNLANKK